MLNSLVHKTAYEKTIDALGVPLVWHSATHSNVTKSIVAGIRILGSQDEVLVNAYGIGGRLITVKAADFAVAPEKFDRLTIDGEVYVIEAVQAVHLNLVLVGYRIFTKGR